MKRPRSPLSKFAFLCSVLMTAGLVQINSGVLADSGRPAGILSTASQTFDFGMGDCPLQSLDARGGFFFVGAVRAGCNMQDWSAVSKFSFDGTKHWTVNFGTQYSWLTNVEALSNGGVAVVGMTSGSVFGQSSPANWDAFIVVLDSAGQLIWASQFGDSGTNYLNDVEETEAGNLIAVGLSESAFVGAPNNGGQDGLLVSYSSSGVQQWIRQIGSTGSDQFSTLTQVDSTNYLVGGVAAGQLLGVSVVGTTDALVLPVTTDGTVGVPSMINVGSIDVSRAVAVTSSGVVVVAGTSSTSSNWPNSYLLQSHWTATIQNGVVATSVWESSTDTNVLNFSYIDRFAMDSDGRPVALGQRVGTSGTSDTIRGTMQIVSDSGTLSSPISLSSSLVSQGTNTSGRLLAAVKNPDGKLLLISTNGFSEVLSVPSAPTGLTAVPASRQVVLSWDSPTSGGGVPISDYRVKYRRVGDSIWTTFNDGVGVNRRAAVPLNPDYNYEFQVIAINGLGVGEATTTITSRPLAADSSWNFVYGSPGLFDYSVFLRSVPREDGSAYFLGQFSGDFEGFSAGSKYKPFVQYRNAAGQIQWTKEVLPEEQGCLVDYAIDQAFVDDLGNFYFSLHWCPDPNMTGSTFQSQRDLMSVTSAGELSVLDQTEINIDAEMSDPWIPSNYAYNYTWSSMQFTFKPVPGGGAEVLTLGKNCSTTCRTYGILRRFDSSFTQIWKTILPSEVLPQALSLAVVSDGSSWVVGKVPKPLPHMQDALALVHISANGTYLTTVKDYTFTCFSEISRVTVDSVWIWTCAKNVTTNPVPKALNAFNPVNGSWLGEIPGTRHPDSAGYCSPSECPIINGFPRFTTFSQDGEYAYQLCNSGCASDNQRDVFKVEGTGIDILFTKLMRSESGAGETVEDVFVKVGGEIVEVGSTVNGLSGQSILDRQITSVGSTRAFVRTVLVTRRTTASAPTLLVATPGNAQASIAFTAGSNGGAAISNYEYSTNNGTTWKAFSPADTTTPVVITMRSDAASAPVNGTTYAVKLRAVNSAGKGTASSAVSVTPRPTANAPTINAVTASSGRLTVTFTKPSSNGGATITNYEYSTNNGTTWKAFSPADTTTPLVITRRSDTTGSLVKGAIYKVRIRAINSKGRGTASASKTITAK